MATLESNWPAIRNAIVRTVELTASFGLNGQTLRADSALLPIAYYLYARDVPDNYVTHSQFASDRQEIRQWLVRSLLKASGIWGSGLDTLLTALRDVIRNNGKGAFPIGSLCQTMDGRGKSLTFSPAEIDDLLSMQYGDKRLFALLSLLFTFVDLRNQFHIDHVFPISRFTQSKLRKAGISEKEIDELSRQANELPNLQLLDGPANIEKRASLPAEWLGVRYSNKPDLDHYASIHLLGAVPTDISGCAEFWAARRDRLREKITQILNHQTTSVGDEAEAS